MVGLCSRIVGDLNWSIVIVCSGDLSLAVTSRLGLDDLIWSIVKSLVKRFCLVKVFVFQS